MYALFKDGQQVSKAHSTRLAAATEAMEAGAMVSSVGDFSGSGRLPVRLASGYEIREVAGTN